MNKINDIEYFDVKEISEKFLKRKTEEEIIKLLEEGKINGKKLENRWYADKEAIDFYIELFLNDKYLTVGPFDIDLTGVNMNGRILDIGGGGEGVIGQLKGEQVVAIDPSKRELEEATESKALNIIMNAKDLKFIDNTFDTVSIFFTMMYIPLNDHEKVFNEIHRVLKPNGELFLWDFIIPKEKFNEKKENIILLKVKIDEKIIDTGYGTKWEKERDVLHFISLGKDVGFEVLEQKIEENMFFLKYKKT
ncbi:MAG: class I SAM-dependent methyltransferase [Promethearchaeota archaeon]|jgi:ubiquinone/menaquinone biosynthesis C-methylase UbiE